MDSPNLTEKTALGNSPAANANRGAEKLLQMASSCKMADVWDQPEAKKMVGSSSPAPYDAGAGGV
jgi:hypothetical protein